MQSFLFDSLNEIVSHYKRMSGLPRGDAIIKYVLNHQLHHPLQSTRSGHSASIILLHKQEAIVRTYSTFVCDCRNIMNFLHSVLHSDAVAVWFFFKLVNISTCHDFLIPFLSSRVLATRIPTG